jgi:hypothetical protein
MPSIPVLIAFGIATAATAALTGLNFFRLRDRDRIADARFADLSDFLESQRQLRIAEKRAEAAEVIACVAVSLLTPAHREHLVTYAAELGVALEIRDPTTAPKLN